MNREEALRIWAPQSSPWGGWTKRVLFSFMSDPLPDQKASVTGGWKAADSSDAAIVVELGGAEAVLAGLELAKCGYRPIPLFNACPYALDMVGDEAPALVNVMGILRALEANTEELDRMRLAESARPAFLLDANRSKGPLFPGAAIFDNRSIVRQSDVPSGKVFRAAGIQRVILVREADRASGSVAADMYSILLSWQNDGLQIETQGYQEVWNPGSYTVKRRNALVVAFGQFVTWLSFRTNVLGSFNRTLHSSGGGGG